MLGRSERIVKGEGYVKTTKLNDGITFYDLFLRSMEKLVEQKFSGRHQSSRDRKNHHGLVSKEELQSLVDEILIQHQLHPSCSILQYNGKH